jgi:LmbE family N-acetylglucosaminyl deacetylase
MFNKSDILVTSAHPDDFEIGMGQYLFELLKPEHGNRVRLCIVTDGGAGGYSRVRRKEQNAVVRFLRELYPETFTGLHPQSYAFPDTELEPSKALVSYLDKVCRGSDVVFTHYPEDSHQDHRALGICVRPACRFVRNVLFYQSYSALNFQPSVFYDFTRKEMESEQGKLRLLKFHTSQVKRYRGSNQDVEQDMFALAAYNGFLYKTPKRFAEGFMPWRLKLNR